MIVGSIVEHFNIDTWKDSTIYAQVQELEEQRERELDEAALIADFYAASGLF